MKTFERDMSTILAGSDGPVDSYQTQLSEVEFSEEEGYKDAHGTFTGVGDTVYGTFDIPVEVPMGVIEDHRIVMQDIGLHSMLFLDGHFAGGLDSNGELRQPLRGGSAAAEDPADSFRTSIARKNNIREKGLRPVQNVDEVYIFENVLHPNFSMPPIAARILANYALNRQGLGIRGYIGGYELERARLTALELAPKYILDADGKRFGVSDVSQNGIRPWAVLHSNPEGRELSELMTPTFYYQSGSHAVWRALLAQVNDDGWLAKGMGGGENSVDASLTLQKNFATLLDNPVPDYNVYGPSLAMHVVETVHGDGDKWKDHQTATMLATLVMHSAGVQVSLDEAYYYNQSSPIVAPVHNTTYGRSTENAPLFFDAYKPDFSKVLDSWQTDSREYGRVQVKVVPSRNNKINYAVYELETDQGTQRWIGTAQNMEAPVTTLGIPTRWPGLSDELIKPPIDYKGDGTGYGPQRTRKTRFDIFASRSIAARRAKGQTVS